MISNTKTKEIFLTQAQYNARQTAGTLESGVVYNITDAKIEESDLSTAVQNKLVFVATYNTTTYAEVLAAFNAGKVIFVHWEAAYGNRYVPLWEYYSDRFAFQAINTGFDCITITLNSGGWSTGSQELERANNKITTITSGSTNTQYPSAKCVYDNLQLKEDSCSIATTLPATASVNTHYDLGEQSTLSIVLPSTASLGDSIIVDFLSGATATTISITSSAGMSEYDLIPSTNKIYQLYFEFIKIDSSNYGWSIGYKEWTKATQSA